MKTDIEKNIIDLLGKKCTYKEDQKAVILNYQREGDLFKLIISFDGEVKDVEKTESQLDRYLVHFRIRPKDDDNLPDTYTPPNNNLMPAIVKKHNDVFSKLTDGLMDDLKKVRDDPKYIQQARQASATTQTIINIAKQEISTLLAVNSI